MTLSSWLGKLREDADKARFGAMGQQDTVLALIEVAEAAEMADALIEHLAQGPGLVHRGRNYYELPKRMKDRPSAVLAMLRPALSRLQALAEREAK